MHSMASAPKEVAGRRQRLTRYVTWTAEDVRQFHEALAVQRTLDKSGDWQCEDAGAGGAG